MSDLTGLTDDELFQQYAHVAAASRPQIGIQPTPGMTWRREHDPTSEEWQAKYGPTAGMSGAQLGLAGIGQGMSNVTRHAGNIVGLESDQALKDAKALDQPLLNTPAGRLGALGGETAMLAPATMGLEGAAGLTGLGAKALSIPLLRGALEGAGQGALMADPGQKGMGSLVGAGTGMVIPALGMAANKLSYGINRTPEAQELMDRGVRLTPGQMNPEGVVNKVEENVRGFPFVGNTVENARNRAQNDFQRGVIEEASAPGYKLQSSSSDANELFQEAQDSYKPLYQAAEGFKVQPLDPTRNQTLARSLQDAANDKTVGAGADIRQNAQDFLEGKFNASAEKAQSTGGWKSEHLIQLRSAINEEIRGAGQDQAGKKYAQLLRAARDRVTDSINAQIPPEAAQALQTANDAYPKLAIIRDAIKRGGDQASGFTPAQLSQAVRQATDNNEYARGGGLMRDWSGPGRDIFTERNPRTGHAFGTAGILGYLGLHHPYMTLPAAAAGLGLVGTDVGRNLVSGQTAPQLYSQKLIEALQNSTTAGERQAIGAGARTSLNREFARQLLSQDQNQ